LTGGGKHAIMTQKIRICLREDDNMTLSKLAQLANVSVSVVSKAFSGREDVSDAMREHVFAVAREHGCFHQFYHVPYDKPVVAVIFPELISQYYIHYMQTLKAAMEEHGYTMLLSISNFDAQMMDELIRYHLEHGKVDALIVFGAVKEEFSKGNTVLACFGDAAESKADVTVTLSSAHGMTQALTFLSEQGHRRIAYIGEPLTEAKEKQMRTLMDALGLEIRPEYMICSRSRFAEAGIDGVRRLWRMEQRPTAIFGAYGYITQGILEELAAMGVSVPGDVSVISMDNDPFPLHRQRDVACIPSATEAVCEQMMAALAARLGGRRKKSPEHILIQKDFYIGDTVGPAVE